MVLTSLAYHIDLKWLHEAYLRTRPDGAAGVDGQTIRDFNKELGANLRALLEQAKSGTCRAPPVRKETGSETSPIGIPTFEDKGLQRAVVMALKPIYEQDFHNGSYGFRPGRSAHEALTALWEQTMAIRGGWIVEVDIRKFFDTLDHAQLREFLQRRVRDGVLLRLIGNWLNAGDLEGGTWTTPGAGTPQGGVNTPPTISRILVSWTVLYLVRGSDRATGRSGRQAGSEAAFCYADLQEVSRHGRFVAAVGAAGGAWLSATPTVEPSAS
jgi:RNA-directed DNA polymerase